MSLADELNWRPATELAGLIRRKALSPVELLRAHLETIERLNPKINAICTLATESAIGAARRAEQMVMSGGDVGLLHGVPIGIKDLTPTAGIRTTFGSPFYADHVPSEDAAVVKRIKQAGAIVVGKTNTPEFGAGANTVNRLFGATRKRSLGREPQKEGCQLAQKLSKIFVQNGADLWDQRRVLFSCAASATSRVFGTTIARQV